MPKFAIIRIICMVIGYHGSKAQSSGKDTIILSHHFYSRTRGIYISWGIYFGGNPCWTTPYCQRLNRFLFLLFWLVVQQRGNTLRRCALANFLWISIEHPCAQGDCQNHFFHINMLYQFTYRVFFSRLISILSKWLKKPITVSISSLGFHTKCNRSVGVCGFE